MKQSISKVSQTKLKESIAKSGTAGFCVKLWLCLSDIRVLSVLTSDFFSSVWCVCVHVYMCG